MSGTREIYTREDVEEQLRGIIMATMASSLGTSGVPFLDMAANQALMAARIKTDLAVVLERYGLGLDEFNVSSISVPEELQVALDKRIAMGMAGDLGKYTQYQVANAIPLAAQNEGGLAGVGAGLSAGMVFGQTMAQSMQAAQQASQAGQPAAAAPAPAAGRGSSRNQAGKAQGPVRQGPYLAGRLRHRQGRVAEEADRLKPPQ